MSKDIKATLIFCEGPHDVGYVRMVFRKLMGFDYVKLKFSDMPSPFHRLFSTAVQKHAAQDMALDFAHKFFLPDSVLRKGDDLVFLFNSGGKTKFEKVRQLLADYIPTLGQAKTFAQGAQEVTVAVKYMFLYDTDADGLAKISRRVVKEFAEVAGTPFLTAPWKTPQSKFGLLSDDKALYVWGDTPDKGTLEDIVLPMITSDHGDLVKQAEDAMSEMFTWKTDHEKPERAVAEAEKYKKAVITTAGQRANSGLSMTVIIERSELITPELLRKCSKTKDFVEFVGEFAGLTP